MLLFEINVLWDYNMEFAFLHSFTTRILTNKPNRNINRIESESGE